MPPKIKTTKEDIVAAALELVRASGEQAINARAIAAALNCSTQPVFSNFETMDQLRQAVILAAYERYLGYIKREVEKGDYPRYKAFGMAYVRFAREEKELFKLLFMRDRTTEDLTPTPDFEESARMMMEASGVSLEKARLMHLELWTCVHGIGVMIATSFLPLDIEIVSRMMTDVYMGIKARYQLEEK